MNECNNYKLSISTSISFLSIITGIIYFSAYKTCLYNKKMLNKINKIIETNKEIEEKLNKITTFVSVYDFKKLEINEFPNYSIVDNVDIPPTPPTSPVDTICEPVTNDKHDDDDYEDDDVYDKLSVDDNYGKNCLISKLFSWK